MNMANEMVGGLTVVGIVTGTHVLEDIQVAVPHRVAVYIPAEQALRSKDLYRALGQGRIFKLDGGFRSAPMGTPPPSPSNELQLRNDELEKENHRLRQDLGASERRNQGLQQALEALHGQLDAILNVLGRIESKDPVPLVLAQGQLVAASAQSKAAAVGVVGGDAPAFVPDNIKPADAEVRIKVETSSSKATNVADAASKLRELRKSGG